MNKTRTHTLSLIAVLLLCPFSTAAQDPPQTAELKKLLEAETSAPATAHFQKMARIVPLVTVWPTLSPTAKTRVLRIAKLHRDDQTRAVLLRRGCAEPTVVVRKECVQIVGTSREPVALEALLLAAEHDDAEGDRAARLLGTRAKREQLPKLLALVAAAPERRALARTTARTYWRVIANAAEHASVIESVKSTLSTKESMLAFVRALGTSKPSNRKDPGGILATAIQGLSTEETFATTHGMLLAARHLSHDSSGVDAWVTTMLDHKLWMLRVAALEAAAIRHPPRAAPSIRAAIRDPSPRVRTRALQLLAESDPADDRDQLLEASLDNEPWPIVRAAAVSGLGKAGQFATVEARIRDNARRVREQAMRSLRTAPEATRTAAVVHLLQKEVEWPQVQIAAIDIAEETCLDVESELRTFILSRDAQQKAKSARGEDALVRALVAFDQLVARTTLQELASELQSAIARSTSERILASEHQPKCDRSDSGATTLTSQSQ